jgi:hypothetical protein
VDAFVQRLVVGQLGASAGVGVYRASSRAFDALWTFGAQAAVFYPLMRVGKVEGIVEFSPVVLPAVRGTALWLLPLGVGIRF